MSKWKKVALWKKILIGVVIGLIIGLVSPKAAEVISPLGDIFLRMLKMLIVPLVFFSITSGVCKMGDVKQLRTVGIRYVLWIMASAVIAAICGGPIWLQLALFFVVSIVCLAATRPLVKKLLHKDVTATNADRVLGQTARVTENIDNAVPTGAVYVGGMTWTARSESGQPIPRNAQVKIVRMEGVRLFVEPV